VTGLNSYRVQWIVVEQYEPDVGGAGERKLVYDSDLIVPQQNGRHVLETGERELVERLEWRVLDGQLPEPAEPAKREPIQPTYAVGVQRQLSQVPETAESIGGQVRQVIFGHRQMFDGLG